MNYDQTVVDGLIGLIEERMILMNKGLLTMKEAVIYTGLSKHTLHAYCAKKIIPHTKPTNRLVYFEKADLDAFMRRGRVESNESIQEIAIRRLA